MGEALIIRSGVNSQSGGGYTQKMVIINASQDWIVPKSKGQNFAVRIFGGGGAAGYKIMGDYYGKGTPNISSAGGGGGNMNNALLKLNAGDVITVSIGSTSHSGNGGTTSFGTYLSATGGESPNANNGGNGGSGGGGCGVRGCGGHGMYGGGGGAAYYGNYMEKVNIVGGNGGIYGGGGGTPANANIAISIGGYGNGGNLTTESTNGLNTINLAAELEFVGMGLKGNKKGENYESFLYYHGEGGGGYGGNGGNCGTLILSGYRYVYGGGGGGGGYGGDGGSGTTGMQGQGYAGGGGGGYGNNGDNGYSIEGSTQRQCYGGGGGGYGPEGYGHGGTFTIESNNRSGKSGVCIISYLEPVQ